MLLCEFVMNNKKLKKKKMQLASSASEAGHQAGEMDQTVYTDSSAQTG